MCTMRIVLGWVGAAVVLLGSIVAGVAVANATVFSASAFAREYLDALAAGRVDEVLALPGVDANGLDPRLLDPLAVGSFDYALGDDVERDGVHTMAVSFSAGSSSAATTLRIERVGARFGLFPEWGFASSPVTALTIATTGDSRLTVGELPLQLDGPTTFAALTPGLYRLAHSSAFLRADPVVGVATGGEASAQLDIVPNDAFLAAAQDAMAADLTACAAQQVLFPTGCPFGFAIENRVASPPIWTVTTMPTASVVSSDRLGLWAVPPADGVAHLRVEVQSLFDGSVSTLEKDVPFSAGYRVAFDGDTVLLDPALR